ncbi:MAG: phosphoribosylformylglycinamidine synthase I [Candidatus Doudnabacteria bacterium]|nr:phosphoribosylformylglycinamidine synthase I [Candidatus Doudnabacteria bacterium]
MKKPQVCILRTDGTNCDEESSRAFTKAGGECTSAHVNELRNGSHELSGYQILVIPGGFSYGDDIVSGKILAVELLSFLRDQLSEFVDRGNLIIGICNGFQVLVRTGLLPFRELGTMSATLTDNDSGSFHCRWIELALRASPCVFTSGMEGKEVMFQMAHGEGKFFAGDDVLSKLEEKRLVPIRYVDNPNGSLNNIAGVCDPTGRIFGLMPHPERFVEVYQHPNWRRISNLKPQGLPIFQNGVNFAAQNLM